MSYALSHQDGGLLILFWFACQIRTIPPPRFRLYSPPLDHRFQWYPKLAQNVCYPAHFSALHWAENHSRSRLKIMASTLYGPVKLSSNPLLSLPRLQGSPERIPKHPSCAAPRRHCFGQTQRLGETLSVPVFCSGSRMGTTLSLSKKSPR